MSTSEIPQPVRGALGASNVDPQHMKWTASDVDRPQTNCLGEATMTLPNKTEHRAIVDTHRHPIGPKLAAKMAERGLYDPKQEFPQANAQDLICYREFFDLDYAIPKQRAGGVTLSLAVLQVCSRGENLRR
jgi:hypothetical protein